MYITKQILNQKVKRKNLPHTRQIFNEIQSSMQNQKYNLEKSLKSLKRENEEKTRPKTANSKKSYKKLYTEEPQDLNNSFVNNIKCKFNEIKYLSDEFDEAFDLNKKRVNKEKVKFSKRVEEIRRRIEEKQNQQIKKRIRLKNSHGTKQMFGQNNFIGYPRQKVRKTIPIFKAQKQDINKIIRCIKGGYVQDKDQLTETLCLSELKSIKKKFLTFDALYHCVKGKRNGRIKDIKTEEIDTNSLINVVYYCENVKNLRAGQKMEVREKIRCID